MLFKVKLLYIKQFLVLGVFLSLSNFSIYSQSNSLTLKSNSEFNKDTVEFPSKDSVYLDLNYYNKTRAEKNNHTEYNQNLNKFEVVERGVLNDNICTAHEISLTDEKCFSQKGGNFNANPDYFNGCINENHKSVWYKFLLDANFSGVEIEVLCDTTKNVELMLVTANCLNEVVNDFNVIEAKCSNFPYVYEFQNLDKKEYYLMLSTSDENILTDLEICITPLSSE